MGASAGQLVSEIERTWCTCIDARLLPVMLVSQLPGLVLQLPGPM